MLNVTITLSVLILVVLGIRVLFRERISPVLQYALWGILPLRMLVYGCEALFLALPRSKFNAVYMAEGIVRRAGAVTEAGAAKGLMGDVQGSNLAGSVTSTATAGFTENGPEWTQLLMLVWALGSIVVLGWFLLVNYRFYGKLRENRRPIDACIIEGVLQGLPQIGKLPVYVCEAISTPCLAGIRRKIIYIPPKVEQDEMLLRYAMVHELCHRKHLDLVWSTMRSLILALFWYNPLMWVAAFLSKRDCEMACDAAVIRWIGQTERLAYGRALIKLVSIQSQKPHFMCTATTMFDSVQGMRERIARIAANRKMAMAGLIAVMVVTITAGACTFTEAAEMTTPLQTAKQEEFLQLGRKWAMAYCDRDGETLLSMCADEKIFEDMGGVVLKSVGADDAETVPKAIIGISSPWPWYSEECSFELNGDKLRIYMWWHAGQNVSPGIFELSCEKTNGGAYKVTEITLKNDRLNSKANFKEIHRYGYAVYSSAEMVNGYQSIVDTYPDDNIGTSKTETYKTVLTDPVKAAVYELNLENVKASLKNGSDPSSGQVFVTLKWQDGSTEIKMIQPDVRGENGIWVPVA